jgi:hypothetical protein
LKTFTVIASIFLFAFGFVPPALLILTVVYLVAGNFHVSIVLAVLYLGTVIEHKIMTERKDGIL